MGSGGGGKQTSTSTTVQELAPEQRELLKLVIPEAKKFVSNPPEQFKGTGIAGFDPLQQQAQQMTLQAANNIRSGYGQVQQGVGNVAGNLGQMGSGAWNMRNSVFPTLNPTMQFSANAAGDSANRIYNAMNAGNSATAGGLNFLTGGAVLDPSTNPWLKSATEAAIRPAVENFQNVILPSIAGDAISAGGFGGTRQQIAEGLAAQGLQRTIGDTASRIYSDAYGQGLGAMGQALQTRVSQQGQNLQALVNAGQLTQQAANQILQAQLGGFGAQQGFMDSAQNALGQQIQGLMQLPGLIQQGNLLPAQLTSAVGEQRQALNQARLTEQVQKYINEQLLPFAAAQDVAAMAFGIPGGSSTTNTSTTGGQSGGGFNPMQALGMMTMLPGLGKSDRRFKIKIKKIGELSDGLGVYSYEYKSAPGAKQIGLMADEVREKYPFAVVANLGGMLFVRYNRVPTWSEWNVSLSRNDLLGINAA